MKKVYKSKLGLRLYLNFCVPVFLLLMANFSLAQTLVNTTHTNNNGASSIIFNVQNTNAFDIIITEFRCFSPTTGATTSKVIYRTTPFNDLAAPWDGGIVDAGQNGWLLVGNGTPTGSNSIIPVLTNTSITVPAGLTYQFGISMPSISYMTLTSGAGVNTFSGGGVNIKTGDGISWAGGQYPSTPVNYPRGFVGGISFIPAVPCTSPPVAGSIGATLNPVCPNVPSTLTLSGGTGGTGQTYQWQSSTNNTTWTNIPGATFANYTVSQTADTYYRCYVTCTGFSDTTAGFLITTNNFLNCYCTSNATSLADEEILNVSLGTLNNTSTCSTTGGAGSLLNQYSNFTALTPPDLAQGVAYPMSVQAGTCGGNFNNMLKVFIDYNQNGLFTDAGETVYTQPAAIIGPHIENFTFSIPLTASLGLTRMRVVLVETTVATSVNPCGTYTWGETEDYFVNIAPVPTCPQPIGLQSFGATTTNVDLDWTPVGVETQWQLQYGTQGFTLGTGTIVTVNTNSNHLLGGLTPNTFYQVYVRAVCGAGDTSFWAPSLSFNTYGLGTYMEANNDCHPNGYIDISQTGTSSILSADGTTSFPVPFPMYFQSNLINSYTICNNGAVLFNSNVTTFTAANVNTIGTNAVQGLYPYWDDMEDNNGLVYWEAQGTSPNQRFIVQWDKKQDLFLGGDTLQYQIILEEATGQIYYQYKTKTVGSVTYDNGASATVGLKGPSQNFPLSFNSATYLSNNSCVKFYYTNCPKPQNLIVDYILADEVSLTWSAGISNETNWTVVYGPTGFDPATSGTALTTTSSTNFLISGLTQNTVYDFYVFADCTPTLQSFGLMTTINTLPFCSNPTGITTATDIDSVYTAWNWAGYPGGAYPATGFNLQYGSLGFANGSGTVISNSDLTAPYNDTTFSAAFLSGGVYEMYVQAVCGNDTSSYIGPFVFTMPLTNDTICGAELLPVDGQARSFSNAGATVETNESVIAPPATGAQTTDGWINSNVHFTTWFKFVAPASGNMRISGVDAGFNGQMAVYSASSCSPITSLVLEAANDNEIDGTSLAPNFTVCGLTPGVTYFLMHDSFSSTATGVYSIKLSQISLDAGNTTSLLNLCYGDTVDLFTGIAGQQTGGNWLDTDGTFHIVGGNLFNSNGLAPGVYDFEYRIEDGCAYDSAMASVQIYPLSTAGVGGTITICKNEPTDLLQGLTGIYQTGGQWTDPNSSPLSTSVIEWGTLFVPGNYNYSYTVGNGVCPDVSTTVTVIVNPACDFLGLEDLDLTGVKFFPNPTSNVLNLEADGLKEDLNLVLTDLNGKVVWTGVLSKDAGAIQVDVTAYDRGMYILKLNDSKTSNTIRVVKN